MESTNNSVYKLPIELVHEISGYLDPEDVASLALTCKWILICHGKSKLRLGALNRELLLARLAQELPGKNYCVYCRKIHRSVPGYEHSWHKDFWQQCRPDRNAAWDLWANGRMSWAYGGRFLGSWLDYQYLSIAPGYLLHWKHIQYLMTHHRHGRDVRADLAQFAHAADLPTPSGQHVSYAIAAQVSAGAPSPRIPAGAADAAQSELLLRTVFRAPPGADLGVHLCPHLRWRPGYITPHQGSSAVTFAPGAGLQQCDKCYTECAIEQIPDARLQATVWSNFGAGVDVADIRRHAAQAGPGVGAFPRGGVAGAWCAAEGGAAGAEAIAHEQGRAREAWEERMDLDELEERSSRDSMDSLRDRLDDILP